MTTMRDFHRTDLSPEERAQLERIALDGRPNMARRAQIVLRRADGWSLGAIAKSVGLHRDSVRRSLIRYSKEGLEGLQHRNTGKARNVVFAGDVREEIRRRASLPPSAVGENFPNWSLYKLREHLVRKGVVRTISIERLRQLLDAGQISRQHWHKATLDIGPLPPEVRHELVAMARQAESNQARRARAVLAVADGATVAAVAGTLHLGKNSIRRWLDSFRLGGTAALAARRESRFHAHRAEVAGGSSPRFEAPLQLGASTDRSH
jgi:transposase